MQPFPIGTVVRSKSNESSKHYMSHVYGQLDRLRVKGPYMARRPGDSGSETHVTLERLDGSDPTQEGYSNCVPIDMLVVDTFLHACREAVKEA